MWKHAWVNNASQFQTRWEGLRVTNGEGIGFVSQGSRDWHDYRVRSEITPLLAKAWGLAARVQGRERYYALMFDAVDGGRVKLVKRDHDENILAKDSLAWELDRPYALELRLRDTQIQAFIDGTEVFSVRDEDRLPLRGGAAGSSSIRDQSPAKRPCFSNLMSCYVDRHSHRFETHVLACLAFGVIGDAMERRPRTSSRRRSSSASAGWIGSKATEPMTRSCAT